MFIFDWDDTLLALSELVQLGIKPLSEVSVSAEVKDQLQRIEAAAYDVLALALELGTRVCVVTNAQHGWVQLSARHFLPGLLELLKKCHITSARTMFEQTFPGDHVRWKSSAIFGQIQAHPKLTTFNGEMNVIAFGDSESDRRAVLDVGREFPYAQTKNIKFVEQPSFEQLRNELQLILGSMHDIVEYTGDLDLMLTVSQLEAQGEAEMEQ